MSDQKAFVNVDLRHAILMIARALDYVGIDDFNHGHRVGYIAFECAKRLGWSDSRQEYVFLAGLLHDCGVSSTNEHLSLLDGMAPEGADAHCIRGYDYLTSCIVLLPFAEVVRYHHTRWDVLKDLDIGEPEREAAALIYLADRVDVLRATYMDANHPETIVLHEAEVAESLKRFSGDLFRPEYVEVMAELARVDGFWFTMDQAFIEGIGESFGKDGGYDIPMNISEVTNLALVMSRIVDAKSPFTHEHSKFVAAVSMELAREMGLAAGQQQQVHIAGLLHDLGKLRVPDPILHHPGPLNDAEYSIIRRHVVDTKLALNRCFPDSLIPCWASNHHEKLDGSGYPYKLAGEQLDLPSRIIAVADIFQALAQERPYRGRMTIEEIRAIMKPMVETGKLDPVVYERIESRSNEYYTLALGR